MQPHPQLDSYQVDDARERRLAIRDGMDSRILGFTLDDNLHPPSRWDLRFLWRWAWMDMDSLIRKICGRTPSASGA
jgi:hypothetical protein